jgi:putative addiction module component (TIGR02574 family)
MKYGDQGGNGYCTMDRNAARRPDPTSYIGDQPVTTEVHSVLAAALALPPADRAVVAERLLESLSDADQAEIDAAWAEETLRRLKAFDEGTVKATPAEEVFRELSLRNKP